MWPHNANLSGTLSPMDEESTHFRMDWRIAFGFCVTIVWITAGVTYLVSVVGVGNFIHLPTGDIGSFLEGAFAPLAFLWLVIGHFMQQKEITANTKAIGIQEKSARRLEVHSRRDSYFKLLNLVQDQLGAIASFHYMSVAGPSGTGDITSEEFTEQRTRAGSDDTTWFVRKMLSLLVQARGIPGLEEEILYGTDIRTRHSTNFAITFSKLLDEARAVDTGNMISNALLFGSSTGMLYRIIQHVNGSEPMDPVTGLSGAPVFTTQEEVK
jgi:hypothetical protein